MDFMAVNLLFLFFFKPPIFTLFFFILDTTFTSFWWKGRCGRKRRQGLNMMTMKGSSPARSWVMVNTFYEIGRLGPGVTQKRTTES